MAVHAVERPTFARVYAEQWAPMLRLAVAMVDTRAEAEHVVQDAMLGLYRRYETVANPVGYLRTSVVNGCRKVLRRRALLRRTVSDPIEHDDLGFDHALDAIRHLPSSQRVVIVLRYHQQLSDSEIAAELGIPIGTVKSRIARALDRLREELR